MKIFSFLKDELWWGGEVGRYDQMPISTQDEISLDFRFCGHNQTAPLFLSNKGRIIFCETVFKVAFKNGKIELDSNDKADLITAGENLRDAYNYAATKLYTFEKRKLDPIYFNAPQYNTWVQMGYMQSEEGVLSYAEGLIKNGYKPGILMIDEGWQRGYGDWRFNERFPNPKQMVEKLHKMGFKVMLWIVPFITTDSAVFRSVWSKYYDNLCRNEDNMPSINKWWNGYSASFNLNLEGDRELLGNQLKTLMNDFGIDGFKCDGGNILEYNPQAINGKRRDDFSPEDINSAWVDFGAKFEFTEYKDAFNKMGRAIPQRIIDTRHSWDGNGINKLIPSGLIQNLLGYPYNCPDMIGGGMINPQNANEKLFYDGELFVRTAQLAAFFPIMQFSAAPYEVLEEKYANLVKKAAELHIKLGEKICSLVEKAMETGAPIMQHMEYAFPNEGFERETEQFMLGDDLLVAPVIKQGEVTKRVVLPKGKWQDQFGDTFDGGQTIQYPAPLDIVPYFLKVNI